MRSKTGKHHKTSGFMVYSQGSAEFIGICSNRTLRDFFAVFRLKVVGFWCWCIKVHAKTPGASAEKFFSTLRKTCGERHTCNICSTSYTSRKQTLWIVLVFSRVLAQSLRRIQLEVYKSFLCVYCSRGFGFKSRQSAWRQGRHLSLYSPPTEVVRKRH